MITVQFSHVDPACGAHLDLPPHAVVAWFDSPLHDEPLGVTAERFTRLRGADPRNTPPALRARVITALCRPVRAAPRVPGTADRLDLAARFDVSPGVDTPSWRLRGFTSLNNVDVHLIKHVLGVGSRDPQAACTAWAGLLDEAVPADRLLAWLEDAGCTAWRALRPDHDRDSTPGPPPRLHEDLRAHQRTACIELLATLRERYREAVRDAVAAVSDVGVARHAHLGTPSRRTMHFLDDRGLCVVAKGAPLELAVATGFLVGEPGEEGLGPVPLRRARSRVLRELQLAPAHALIHTPERWRTAS